MTTKISTNNLDTSVTTLIAQGGGPKIVSITYPGNDTAADTAGGQTITLTGSGFVAGATVIINGSAVGVVSVASSTTITFVSPALSAGSYVVYVVNADGGTAIAVPGIQYSGSPAWSTAAGSLGSYTETQVVNNTVTATGDAPVTYSVFSGTLPTGATLNANTGVISGTSVLTPNSTTYTFVIRATDAQNQDTDRQFSLTINPDTVTWSSPAANTNYASAVNAAIANVSLSATAASGQTVTYAANALPTGLSLAAGTISGTPTTAGNVVTLLTATANVTNATATRTISWTISVNNDVNFPYVTTLLSANAPATTFVADASTNAFAVTVNGDTRPTNFGPYTPGYYSAYFGSYSSGNNLTVSLGANGAFGTGDFTVEAWAYFESYPGINAYIIDTRTSGSWSLSWNYNGTVGQENFLSWSNASGAVLQASTGMNVGTWNHCAYVRAGTTGTIYLNGVSIASWTDNGNYSASVTTATIGKRYTTNQSIPGYISNLRIVKGTAVYTGNFTPSTTPLTAIANTVLLTCQSNRFVDNSTNNLAITNSGANMSGFDPFAPSGSFAGLGSGFFDGSGDYLEAPSNSAFVLGSSGNFTIECWIYPNGNPSSSAIVVSTYTDFNPTSGYYNKWNLGFSTATVLTWYDDSGNAGINASSFPINVWSHVAVVRNGATITMYVNGVSVGTQASLQNYTSQSPVRVGLVPNAAAFNGYISNLRIVKGTAVYTTNFTPPTTSLTAIANTQLLILQNNQPNNNSMFLDSSTNNFNITRNGNTTQGSFSPYGGGWSNYFDGSSFQTIPANAAFNLSTADFTIEFWAFLQPYVANGASSYWASIIGIGVGASDANSVTNTVAIWQGDGTGTSTVAGEYTVIISGSSTNQQRLHSGVAGYNRWTHVALTRSSGVFRLWQDGVLRDSATLSADISRNDYQVIGKSINSNIRGYISNLRVVKGTAVYTTAFTPPTAPLTPITNTSLLTCADNRFIDDSANGFAITTTGTPTVQRFNPFNPVVTTPTSYSGYFDGTGDYLSLAANSAFELHNSTNFTIETWVYNMGAGAERYLFSKRADGPAGGWELRINATNLMQFFYTGGNSLTTASAIPASAWTHVAVSRSGSTVRMFINGNLDATATFSNGSSASGSALYIGNSTSAGGGLMLGYMSNSRIVNGTALYTTNFTPSTTPLSAVANTVLLTCQSATFTDTSANAFAITANGDAAPRQFNPFGWTTTTGTSAAYTPALYGGSAYFDGTGDYLNFTGGAATAIGTSSATVEFWMYATANDGYRRIICSTSGGFSSGTFVIRFNNGGFLAGSGTTHITVATLPVTNRWYHVAWVGVGSTSQTLYLDGVSVGTAGSYDLTESISLIGGYYSVNSSEWFAGYLSNVRITKGQALYRSNFQPPVSPLTALPNTVLLNNMTGAGIYDSSMMVNYETVGNSGISTSIKKYGSSSLYFDGTGDYLPATTSPNFAFGTGDFTVEAWIYTADVSYSAQRGFIQTSATVGGLSTSYTTGIIILFGGSSFGSVNANVGGSSYDSGGSTVATNTWYHVALTRASGVVNLWLNGVSVSSGSGNTANLTGQNLVVGGYYSTGYLYNGYLDDVRITRGLARYTSTFTPPSTPFISN